MVYAEPENLLDPSAKDKFDLNASRSTPVLPIHGGQNANELLTMLQSLQNNILQKLAMSQTAVGNMSETDIQRLLQTVLPLGFTQNKQHVQNLALILTKNLSNIYQITVFDKHQHLVDLLISVI